MPSELGEANVIVRAKLDKLDTDLAGVKGRVSSILKGAAAAGAVAMVALGAATIAATAKIIAFSSEVRQSNKDIVASLGVTEQEAKRLGEVAVEVFRDNFYGSITEATAALIEARKQLGNLSDVELKEATENAGRLSDVFGVDYVDSLNAVKVLQEEFGLTVDQSFDFIAGGFQRGLNSSGDFLDTVTEYGNLFAENGASAGEFFSTLESGLAGGVLGTDKIADAFKEFGVRIVDGSDTTREALDLLFSATEFPYLKSTIDETTEALEKNKIAIEEAEGAYAASKSIVDDLRQALGDARRELSELSKPKLAGMQKYDDQLFELEQQAKNAKLALLDTEPDTDAYKAAREILEKINRQMDRISLKRDLEFDRQLRDIEQAATAGTEPLVTYDEAMAKIAAKKDDIAKLEEAFAGAADQMEDDGAVLQELVDRHEDLNGKMANLQGFLASARRESDEFLGSLSDGSLTGIEAMNEIIAKIREIEDPLLQNQIGVALFGTQWEDLGASAMLSLDTQKTGMGDLADSIDKLDAKYDNWNSRWEGIKRVALIALAPIGDKLLELADEAIPSIEAAMEKAQPILEDFAGEMGEKLGPAAREILDAFGRIAEAVGLADENSDSLTATLELLRGILDLIVGSVDVVVGYFDFLAWNIEQLMKPINYLIEKWDELKKTFETDIGLPDWLTPGSPTPLELGIRGLNSALDQLPDFSGKFGGGMPAMAGLGGGGGGGISNTTIVNIDGVSAMSSGGDSVDEAIRLTVQLLRQQLKRR